MSERLPVNTPEFWKTRLHDAYRKGHLHYSVYLCPPPMWRAIFEAHKAILQRETEPGMKVLDAGCGYGRTACLFNVRDYTGVDLSPDLLSVAREQYPEKTFLEARLENLPFKDYHFDVAFCTSIKAMVISNLGEEAWGAIERELKRVAKKVLVLEYETPDEYTIL